MIKNGLKLASVLLCFLLVLSGLIMPGGGFVTNEEADEDSASRASRSGPVYQNEQEPNDNFAQAELNNEIICPDTNPLKCNGSLNPSSDFQDIWAIHVTRGFIQTSQGKVIGAANPDKFKITLNCISISSGCVMYMYDADKHLLATSGPALVGNPGCEFNIVAQVNSSLYIEVRPNSGSGSGNYSLVIDNFTESLNPAFDNTERFSTALSFNITQGYNSPGLQDLSHTHDNADFYQFYAYKGQTIKIVMTISTSNADFGMQLFDDAYQSALLPKADQHHNGGTETIVYSNPKNQTLYLRCFAPIDLPLRPGSEGKYTLQCTGNLPPLWNSSFIDTYMLDEDAPPMFIDLTPAFHEWNPADANKIELDLFEVQNGYWVKDGKSIQENGTFDLLSNKSLELTPNPDKYGAEIIQIRATDDERDLFTYHNFTINILPFNDLPTLNGTNKWLLGPDVIYDSKGTKVFCDEGGMFECTVTAWNPKDSGDKITFYDDTDMFDINRITGEISFHATYHYTGPHDVKITARDNGQAPNETTKSFEFIINPSNEYPIVSLDSPENDSVQFTLIPEFRWRQTNIDYFNTNVTYDFYLSTDEKLVRTRDPKAHNGTFVDITEFKLISELDDLTRYYWTVIPNDGIHLGICESGSGLHTFYTDEFFEVPEIKLIFPEDNKMWDKQSITLSWDLDYAGMDIVYYDVYFGVSMEQLLDPFEAPWESKITDTSYKIDNLYFGSYYYWKVVPFTDKVHGNESNIRSIFVIDDLPRITLNNPAPGTIITPTDNLRLHWTIEYIKPSEITCDLYWGIYSESVDKASVMPINVGNKESYLLTGLTEQKYFWYVVPNLDDLRGHDSEVWTFEIAEIEVPVTIPQLPLNTTLYSPNVRFEWKMFYGEDYDPKNVWYDIYLDNSTDDLQMMTLIMSNWQQNFYDVFLDFEENLTYYWCVIPRVQTSEGNVTGICQSGVLWFKFGVEGARYEITLDLTHTSIIIEQGSKETIHFIVTNTGNIKTKVELSARTAIVGDITLDIEYKTITLGVGEAKNLTLDIFVPPTAELKDYLVTVIATSSESTIVTVSDSIKVVVYEKPPDGGDGEDSEEKPGTSFISSGLGIALVVGIIIAIIVIVFAIMLYQKKDKKQIDIREHFDRGAENQNGEGPNWEHYYESKK